MTTERHPALLTFVAARATGLGVFCAMLIGALMVGPGVLSVAADSSTGYTGGGANGTGAGLPGTGAPPILGTGSSLPWALVAFLVLAGVGSALIAYVISTRQEK